MQAGMARRVALRLLLTLLVITMAGRGTLEAQSGRESPLEVFVMRYPPGAEAGMARLQFVNAATGEVVSVDVRGDRFAIVGGYVQYADPSTGDIYRLWPDGRIERHPFIQPAPETRRIDWVVSPNQQWLAWMLTNDAGGGALQTVTTFARSDGTESRVILTDGPDAFMHAVPIALTDDWIFFFDRQPQGVGDYYFFKQYASIYRLDIAVEAPVPQLLPFEPNCFCGAGLSASGQYFARLEKSSEAGGYDVRLWDLTANVDTFADSLSTRYEAAGAAVISPDGRLVAYSLANNLALDSAGTGRERFMVAIMDRDTGEQRQLLYNPLLVPLLPFSWTEDGTGLLLYNPRQDGTWKLNIESGEVHQVASSTLLGVIR